MNTATSGGSTTVTSGNLAVGMISAGTGITLTSSGAVTELGDDPAVDLQAGGSLVIVAATGIGTGGALETSAGTLSLTSTTGLISVDNRWATGNVALQTLRTTGADLLFTQRGGAGVNLTSASTNRGATIDILDGAGIWVNSISVSTTLNLTTAAGIEELNPDSGIDFGGNLLVLRAGAGVGAMNALELSAWNIDIVAAGAINVENRSGGLTTSRNLESGGSLTYLKTGGGGEQVLRARGANVSLSVVGSAALMVDDVVGAGSVTLASGGSVAELGSDAAVDVRAGGLLSVAAGSGIGATGAIETAAGSLSLTSSTGSIWIVNEWAAGLVALNDLRTTGGNLTFEQRGGAGLAVGTASTNQSATLSVVGSGSMWIHSAVATTGLSLTAPGSIEELNPDAAVDLETASLVVRAGGGVGSLNTFEIAAGLIDVIAVGAINLENRAAGLTTTRALETAGNITYLQSGGGGEQFERVRGAVVSLTTTGSGTLFLGDVVATGNLTITGGGAVAELGSDAGVDAQAGGSLVISAATGIGTTGAIETAAGSISLVSGSGAVSVDNAWGVGMVNLTNLRTTGSDLTFVQRGGAGVNLASGSTNKGGSITVLNGGGIWINGISVATTLTLTVDGDVQELNPDSSIDVGGNLLVIRAGGSVGSLNALELSVWNLDIVSGGSVNVENRSGGVTTTRQISAGGSVTYLKTGGGGEQLQLVRGGDLNFTVVGSATMLVGDVVGLGNVTLTSGGVVDELGADSGVDARAGGTLTISAGQGIGAGGAIEVFATVYHLAGGVGGVNLADANTGEVTIGSLSSGAGRTARFESVASRVVVLSSSTGVGGQLTLQSVNSVFVGNLQAVGASVSITSLAGAVEEWNPDPDVDITASSIQLSGATGVGLLSAIEVSGATLSFFGGSGGVNITSHANTGVVSVTRLETNAGALNFTHVGAAALSLSPINSAGNVSVTTAGNLLVSSIVSGGAISLTAGGSIEEGVSDPDVDLAAPSISLSANGDLLSLELAGLSITLASVAGSISVSNSPSANATILSAAAVGSISIVQTGAFSLAVQELSAGLDASVAAQGGGLGVGSVTAGRNLAISASGSVEEIGSDEAADLTAAVLTITAGGAIGGLGQLEISAPRFSLSAGSGNVWVGNHAATQTTADNIQIASGNLVLAQSGAGPLFVSQANVNGSAQIRSASSTLMIGMVAAQGNIDLATTSAGDLLVDSLASLTGNVWINSAGSIEELSADAEADISAGGGSLSLAAVSGIGNLAAIETSATSLTLVTGQGKVAVANHSSSAATVDSVSTALGDIAITQSGGGSLRITSAQSLLGNLNFAALGADLNVVSASAGSAAAGDGSVWLSSTGGGAISFDWVGAGGDLITAISSSHINEMGADVAADLVADRVELHAATGIGNSGTIEIQAETINTSTTVGLVHYVKINP